MPEPALPWDDGLAKERNTLAWQRTGLSLVGTGAVLAKASGSAIIAAVIFGAAVAGAALLVLHADRRHPSSHARGDVTAPVDVAVTTALAIALALCGLVVVAT